MAKNFTAQYKDKDIRRLLAQINKRAKEFEGRERAFVGAISAMVFTDIDDHFQREMGHNGPWRKWSKSYTDAIGGKVAFRRINGRTVPITRNVKPITPKPQRILKHTGELRKQLKPIEQGRNWRKTSQGVLWFNNARTKSGFPYAYAHDNDDAPRDKLPQRSFMWLSVKGLKKMAKITVSRMLK